MPPTEIPPPPTPPLAPVSPIAPEPGNNGGRNLLIAAVLVLLAVIAALLVLLLTRSSTTSTAVVTSPTPAASPTHSATPAPTPTPAPTSAPTAAPSATAAGLSCTSFPTPLPPLESGTGPAISGASGHGCGNGSAPATAFSAPAGWTIASTYTCNGTAGDNGMGDTLDFTAHNVDTNTDLPTNTGAGLWGTGEGGADGSGATAPAGHYIIVVTLPHPAVNQCEWSFQAHTGAH